MITCNRTRIKEVNRGNLAPVWVVAYRSVRTRRVSASGRNFGGACLGSSEKPE